MVHNRRGKAGTTPSRKLLQGLGSRIVSVLGGLARNAHLGIGAAYITVFAAVAATLLAGGLLDPVADWVRSARGLDTFGNIIVESPEVYTRERLVNDRLRQTVWLRKQMRATEDVLKEGVFRSHEGQWVEDVATVMSVRMAGEEQAGTTESANGAEERQQDRHDASVTNRKGLGASIELFRAMKEYREQVRNELMQTQLDDRHDIDGNTVYRLNFNTTVVHGRRSDALAVIQVKLHHSNVREEAGRRLSDELLRDWAKELERALNVVARDRLKSLMFSDNPDSDAADFYLWLRWKICRKLTQVAAKMSDAEVRVSRLPPSSIGAVREWFKADAGACGEEYYQTHHQGGTDVGDARKADTGSWRLGDRLDRIIGDYVARFRTATRDEELFWKYVEARPELVKEISTRTPAPARTSLEFFRELGRKWCHHLSQQTSRGTTQDEPPRKEVTSGNTEPGRKMANGDESGQLEKTRQDEREKNLVGPLCSRAPTSTSEQETLLAIMNLYWRLETLEKRLPLMSESMLDDTTLLDGFDCEETTTDRIAIVLPNHSEHDARIQELEWLRAERQSMKELLSTEDGLTCLLEHPPELWRSNLTIQHGIDQFNRKFIDGKFTKSDGTGVLNGIFRVEGIGCEVGMCRISVRPDADREVPAECFFRSLNKEFEVFSYGVTPKNWRQRLAFSGSVIRSTAVALETPRLAGAENLGGLVEGAHRDRETLRSVMSQPIVVGFGRGRTRHRTDGPEGDREIGCNSDRGEVGNELAREDRPPADDSRGGPDLSEGTEFGWFIAPERRWGDGGRKWHPHRQYDLSAVISIPSWWRRVKLTVTTCWRKLSEMGDPGFEYIDGCGRGDNDEVAEGTGRVEGESYLIKLPGDVGEISRKLRIEVRDVPFILSQMYTPQFGQYVFHEGKRADIVIEGGRLWRSTRVTMGTQDADEITVLPHMKGIIATFDCVRRPPYASVVTSRPTNSSVENVERQGVHVAPLRVWTSEGVTNPPLPVNILPHPGGIADPCSGEPPPSRPQTAAWPQPQPAASPEPISGGR